MSTGGDCCFHLGIFVDTSEHILHIALASPDPTPHEPPSSIPHRPRQSAKLPLVHSALWTSSDQPLSSSSMAQDPRLLLQKADKAAQGATGGFSFFGGRTEKWENASDLYSQAANAFRMQKQSTFPFLLVRAMPLRSASSSKPALIFATRRLRSRSSLRKVRLDHAR